MNCDCSPEADIVLCIEKFHQIIHEAARRRIAVVQVLQGDNDIESSARGGDATLSFESSQC